MYIKMENTREIITDGLLTLVRESIYSNQLISDILDKYDYLEPRDKAFIKRVFEGTIERQIELDYYINSLSSLPVNKMKPLMRCLIRMSAYQILYMDSVPDSAAINEAVKLAKKRKFANLSGFVNGVLRNLSRSKDNLELPKADKEPVKYLSIKYSVPEWIAEKWLGVYGFEDTRKILEALLAVHPVSIRFMSKLSEEKRDWYVKEIEAKGVELVQNKQLPYVYAASKLEGIAALPGYEEGAFIIQDVSSCLAVEAIGIKEGDFVIDACAAPGGKSMLAAELAGETGKVLSRDLSDNKVDKINENFERVGIKNARAQVWDASRFDEELEEKADVLILDVPCSGLGILGKKRDIKYNATPEGLEELSRLQWEIVSASYRYVKKGGKLLYSTCTINSGENEKQVERIVRELPFEIEKGPVQLLPGTDECDGFFYTVLKRK